ncbi:membrane protein [Roseibacterium elongatum DSM 19469]|uniref:Membrane protein n=1 Tax=Roseicyclus elongatus DSM 19469 TaxID=1294273 RepID=W8S0F7_9RHOB|nr:hypothetical protein [Roseibacterium elongatum]AHM03622.1 membrane protein [Roseibacterium elongatum DSM 19469]
MLRGFITLVVIATPSLLIPGSTPEAAQVVMLVGLILGAFIAFEYATTFPGLVEFRDAPPFNRVRILALFLLLFFLSLVLKTQPGESNLASVATALGLFVADLAGFRYGPIHLVMSHLPDGLSPILLIKIRAMAGLSLLISLTAIVAFAMLVRFHSWPARGFAFNVWVNLPTFDPTAGGDVIKRLRRDGRVNVILGLCTPFLVPVVAVVAAEQAGAFVWSSPHSMVWGLTLWTFIPLSFLMRGLAMGRIADMIMRKRAQLTASVASDAPSDMALSR